MATELTGRQVAAVPARRKPPSLAPYLVAERAIQDLGQVNWMQAIPATISLEVLCLFPDPAEHVAKMCQHCPNDEALVSVVTWAHAALVEPVDRDVTRVAVALLFDARARQPANPEAYVNTLVFDLVDLGYPPAVVAAACQRLRRETVFVPEIAEVIAMCEQVRKSYAARVNIAQRALDAKAAVHEVLERWKDGERPEPRKPAPVRPGHDWEG